jgi:hypothetical protein
MLRRLVFKIKWKLFALHQSIREINVKALQRQAISRINPKSEKVIIFFIPGAQMDTGKEKISGGLISIISLMEETKRIYSNSEKIVLCSTFFNHRKLFKLSSFENSADVFCINIIQDYFQSINEITLHIPELFVGDFVKKNAKSPWLKSISNVRLNILNQNIKLMPAIETLRQLRADYENLTITTAHRKYCTIEYQNKFEIPHHLLSVWISPDKYTKTDFKEKENLILLSPDNDEFNEEFIARMRDCSPNYRCVVIRNVTYEEYKRMITQAKFLVTSGEGLDAYFIETYFSGGVAFAFKNVDFFDDKYLHLDCLIEDGFVNFDDVIKKILSFDRDDKYTHCNSQVNRILEMDYNYNQYKTNLLSFYRGKYSIC